MKIDDTLIAKLEILSKLKLNKEEKEILKTDIGTMITMFDKISEVETTGVIPVRHMTDTQNVFRVDFYKNELSREEGLKNAPLTVGPYFAVPKVIE
ncbi:MAG: Asp-tRNA(Asn)/Glu-tRNA(Gln) amidotransferase subunit GatC [Saprospiraceae bacterium]|nr:Asp-tRNA(Asn)/Glu-tRNA(Gln) amidotransferase subunit GatC [Saprospiraceae bacterium]